MKIKSILKLGTLALLTAALPACSFLDTDPQIIPDDGYYNSEQKLIYGLAGVYGALNSEALYGNYYSLQIANADDLCYFNNYNNSESRPDRYNHSAGTAAIRPIAATGHSDAGQAGRMAASRIRATMIERVRSDSTLRVAESTEPAAAAGLPSRKKWIASSRFCPVSNTLKWRSFLREKVIMLRISAA